VVCGRETNWKQTAASSETKYSLTTSILFQARASFSWFNLCSLLTTQPANSRPTAQQYQQHSIQQTVEFTDFKTVRKFMNFYRIVNKFLKKLQLFNSSVIIIIPHCLVLLVQLTGGVCDGCQRRSARLSSVCLPSRGHISETRQNRPFVTMEHN